MPAALGKGQMRILRVINSFVGEPANWIGKQVRIVRDRRQTGLLANVDNGGFPFDPGPLKGGYLAIDVEALYVLASGFE